MDNKGRDIALVDNIITSESSEASNLEGKEENKLIRYLLTALVL
jgi:hypothetical protein